MSGPQAVYREIITGPRWAGIDTFLKDMAFELGLDIRLDIDNGWIRKTVRVECRGDADSIMKMSRAVTAALEQYNSETGRKQAT